MLTWSSGPEWDQVSMSSTSSPITVDSESLERDKISFVGHPWKEVEAFPISSYLILGHPVTAGSSGFESLHTHPAVL